MDDADPIPLRQRALTWLQATPAEAAGVALLLLGALVATGLFVVQAAQRPGATPGDAAGLIGDVHDGAEVDGAAPDPHEHHHAHPRDAGGVAGDPGLSEPPAAGSAEAGVGADGTGGTSAPASLVVHVTGAVSTPGVVTLDGGARVADAIAAAGGATDDARLDHLNLARLLEDGEHVHLPREGEDPPPPTGGAPGSGGDAAAGAAGGGDAPIDLNRAGEEELQRLPGIGPSKSAAIVRHREEHGPFQVPGDLREVPGIGEKTFQQLADLVTVS
ncbi:ComEA family DNA-binding protein [Egicoccus sp. AB-alg2]|uniref:ComEA family DNA-binding protein n=1 Tax=Egicoccus sp. AB-alg2 TaxID=3242693 RepID=UPI00359DE898